MRSSEKTDMISPALVAVQAKWPRFVKAETAKIQSTKGSYSYSYISLEALLAGAQKALEATGLAVLQEAAGGAEGFVGVATRIVHLSGQWIEYDPLYLPAGDTAQSAGSAISYARRYALMAALGIAAEDDDGASASGAGSRGGSGASVRSPAPASSAGSGAYGEGVPGPADHPSAPNQTVQPVADGAEDPGEVGSVPVMGDGALPPSSDYKATLWATYVRLCGDQDLHIVKTFAKAVPGAWKPADLPEKASEEQLETAIQYAQNAAVPA